MLMPVQPSHGVEFATTTAHAALELEQQERVLELGEGQAASLDEDIRVPVAAPTHDLKQVERARSTTQVGSRRHGCHDQVRCSAALAAPAARRIRHPRRAFLAAMQIGPARQARDRLSRGIQEDGLGIGVTRDQEFALVQQTVMGGAQGDAVAPRVFAAVRASNQVVDVDIAAAIAAGNSAAPRGRAAGRRGPVRRPRRVPERVRG
jgi:hypothetical protein